MLTGHCFLKFTLYTSLKWNNYGEVRIIVDITNYQKEIRFWGFFFFLNKMQTAPLNKLVLKFHQNSVIEHFCIIKCRPHLYEKIILIIKCCYSDNLHLLQV